MLIKILAPKSDPLILIVEHPHSLRPKASCDLGDIASILLSE
jgi:hypothetical protein